jgi:hypothetical protein
MAGIISWGVDLREYPISNQFCTEESTPSSSSVVAAHQEMSSVQEEPAANVSFGK